MSQLKVDTITDSAGTGAPSFTYGVVATKKAVIIAASDDVVPGYRYMVNTGGITLTLPASPTVGTEIEICDGGANFSASPVTIDRNGSNIGGVAANATLNTSNDRFMLIYMNGTYGWGMF